MNSRYIRVLTDEASLVRLTECLIGCYRIARLHIETFNQEKSSPYITGGVVSFMEIRYVAEAHEDHVGQETK